MRIELTDRQVLVVNSALAYYQRAFEDADAFGMSNREAATEGRVAANARQALWDQAPMRDLLNQRGYTR